MDMETRIEKVIDAFILKHRMVNSQTNRDMLADAICISDDKKVVAIHTAAGCEVCGKPRPKKSQLDSMRKTAKVVNADPMRNPE